MAAGRRTRILIVDDSAVMRSLLRSVVCADASLEVAGTAADGASALAGIEILQPDLILLDVEMPVMDGLVTLRELRARGHKIPVIMCSSLTQRGARVTIEALACGASDYVAKPTGQVSREAAMLALTQDLAPKIHALTSQIQCPPQAQTPPALAAVARQPMAQTRRPCARPSQSHLFPRCWPSASPRAVRQPLTFCSLRCRGTFPFRWLVVQHMPELFTGIFAERLNSRCRLQVREAAEGDPLRAGTIYIARGNWHLEVLAALRAGSPPTLHLNQGPQENHCRPAVDALFRSLAGVYGAGVLAVVLTGMGSDGLMGCRMIRDPAAAFWPRTRPPARCGECLARWPMPDWRIVFFRSTSMATEILRILDPKPAAAGQARELLKSVL